MQFLAVFGNNSNDWPIIQIPSPPQKKKTQGVILFLLIEKNIFNNNQKQK